MKVMEENGNLWKFFKVINFALETSGKIIFWFIQEPWMYFIVKSRNFQVFCIVKVMTFAKFVQKKIYTNILLPDIC